MTPARNLYHDNAMLKTTESEQLLFLLRTGYTRWQARMELLEIEVSKSKQDLLWELMLCCHEFLESPSEEPQREAYRIASEIGRRVSEKFDRREAIKYFRDLLLRFLSEAVFSKPECLPALHQFFMAVGDSIWEAYAEQLRSNIRQEKRQRFNEQLRVAKKIQQHLLPKTIPHIEGFDIAGRLTPAEEVGGDYWSVKHYEDDNVVTMKLADVTGHGIAAASLVAAVKFISGGFYSASPDPETVIERTNRVLVMETPSDILVSMIYAWLDPKLRKVRLVNAGHFPAFIAGVGGFRDIPQTGPVLGLMNSTYSEVTEDLHPGEVMVFASDGIIEAGGDRPFGVDRLKQVVADHLDAPASMLADAIIDSVISYSPAVTDDLSVVIAKSI